MLSPWERTPVPSKWKERWDLEAVWAAEKRKYLDPVGIRTVAVQPVASRYADWAIAAPSVQKDPNTFSNTGQQTAKFKQIK